MLVAMATFEHLPVRVGGLAEAVTSLAGTLARNGEDEVFVFMPAHGLAEKPGGLTLEYYADFGITVGDQIYPVRVIQARHGGVRLFLFSNPVLDRPEIYYPREQFMQKMVHYTKALPGLLNLIIKHEQRKPDVLHINDWHCVFAGVLVKKYFRVPLVLTIHRLSNESISARELVEANLSELIESRYLEGDMFKIEVFGAHWCDRLTTVSYSYLEEEWRNFFSAFQGKVTYVFNGIDFYFWDPVHLAGAELPRGERRRRILIQNGLDNEGSCLFFNVGRLDSSQKGIDVLLQAFAALLENGVKEAGSAAGKGCLILAGTGDPLLEAEARRLEIRYPGRVKVKIGYLAREETREYYGASDFCLVPSNFEPFGLVQLEAMSMGCVPIGSRVGGISDTVIDPGDNRDKATGWLVPPRDPAALTAAMASAARILNEQPARIELMRQNGRVHVMEHFSWERAAARYRAVYRDMATLKLPFVNYAEPY